MRSKRIPFNPSCSLFFFLHSWVSVPETFQQAELRVLGKMVLKIQSALLRAAASCHLAYNSNASFSKSMDIKKKNPSGIMVLK